MFDIEEELKKLPHQPGVYIMHNKHDDIIYVGKAISLRNRVRQYFRTSTKKSSKIEQMVKNISRFEYIVTDSELEALILECNLIKKHRPKYNTMLKDDKSYPFIKVTVEEDFPRVLFSRRMGKDKSRYFGPFTSAGAIKDTIELAAGIFKVRTCNKKIYDTKADFEKYLLNIDDEKTFPGKNNSYDRACLNYHIGRCEAPCVGKISKEEYAKNVNRLIDFLSGNQSPILKELEDKMLAASANMEFEDAAKYRDLINSINHIKEHQKITSHSFDDRDVIACATAGDEAVVQVFFIRDGKLIGREHFFLNTLNIINDEYMEDENQNADKSENNENENNEKTDSNDDLTSENIIKKQKIITSFIKQYYGGTPYIPRELHVQYDVYDKEVLESWLKGLSGFKVSIVTPKKGDKEKMIELAFKNATMVLTKDRDKLVREQKRTVDAVTNISDILNIDYAKRIEAYDISNTSGYESVGSMIVFEDGKPKKNAYRKFKIKWVKGANDYKSLEEVLTRRFEHGLKERAELDEKGMDYENGSFSRFPDLIMMDGGLGQVNIALGVMKKLGLNIPISGMVKDDHHSTRGLIYEGKEIPLKKSSEEFKLITRIQDEAHRFAIEFHKSLRGKKQVHSILDDIPGIGPARRKALMRRFGDIDGIRAASIDELKSVDGITETIAEEVYNFFR
ncbi:excinuclease ABC subunit UvrC [uncultured Eubacterium sp.]|uniref:excinuclease ABC subunit UvrC n=1 Tax=uncultured Eubacterium sp. TaxID=165185 RepID=UPI0025940E48|nr:excinuclease ABC subunit UvrC [uncultured Eubacterium sp.]